MVQIGSNLLLENGNKYYYYGSKIIEINYHYNSNDEREEVDIEINYHGYFNSPLTERAITKALKNFYSDNDLCDYLLEIKKSMKSEMRKTFAIALTRKFQIINTKFTITMIL